MRVFLMKKLFFLLAGFFFWTASPAQKIYFIYLQSENQVPFYVKLGDKSYHSNPAGYLILSHLRDSTYTLKIGLPENSSPEQEYRIAVNKKDQGFLLKNFGEQGWGLFNLQSMAVQFSALTVSLPAVKTEKQETNSFTELLAKAADDTTLIEKQVIEKKENKIATPALNVFDTANTHEEKVPNNIGRKKPENTDLENGALDSAGSRNKQIDTASAKKQQAINTESAVEPNRNKDSFERQAEMGKLIEKNILPAGQNADSNMNKSFQAARYQKSQIIRRSESSTTEGFGITFLDVYANGQTDTIRIFIPAARPNLPVSNPKKEEKKFLEFISTDTLPVRLMPEKSENPNPEHSAKTDSITLENKPANKCLQVSTTDDFFRLRKILAAETTEEDMIGQARKAFKEKCYTTEQIKNLSVLFLTDEGKYRFFDAAYPHVTDRDKFNSLQTELNDPYFINRFRAMLF